MPGNTIRTTASVLLAGVFLLSLGGEAYGWHDCPHHHPRSRDVGTPPGADGLDTSYPGERTAPLRPASGRCTCVGSCHATAASPLLSLLDAAPALGGSIFRVRLRPEGRILRQGLTAYLLPYPTGPPAA